MSFFSLINSYRHLWLVMTVGFSVILVGFVILGDQILTEVELQESRTQQLYTYPFRVNAVARDASLAVAQIRIHSLEEISGQNKAGTTETLTSSTRDHDERLAEDLELIEANFLGDLEKAKEVRQLAFNWSVKRAELSELLRKGKQEEARYFLKNQAGPLYVELNQKLEHIREFSSKKAAMLAAEAEVDSHRALQKFKYLIVALFVFTAIAGGVTLKVVLDQLKRRDDQIALEQEGIEHMAHYDALTNLPNRALFYDRLKQALSLAKRNRSELSLLFMDLDGFKKVNDSLGHHYGDLLLKQVAVRLTRCVRESDTVGRIGGDEFTVILIGPDSREDVASIAAKIIESIQIPFDLEGHVVRIGVSIGIDSCSVLTANENDLLNNADMAMYESKKNGKNQYTFFSQAPGVNDEEWIKFDVFHHIGINDLDAQHHGLTRIINRLNSAILSDMPKQELLDQFDELILETAKHFELEERYMSHYCYPGQQVHGEEHAILLNEAQRMREGLMNCDEKLNLQAIRDWLLNHIKHSDKQMADYLLSRGVS